MSAKRNKILFVDVTILIIVSLIAFHNFNLDIKDPLFHKEPWIRRSLTSSLMAISVIYRFSNNIHPKDTLKRHILNIITVVDLLRAAWCSVCEYRQYDLSFCATITIIDHVAMMLSPTLRFALSFISINPQMPHYKKKFILTIATIYSIIFGSLPLLYGCENIDESKECFLGFMWFKGYVNREYCWPNKNILSFRYTPMTIYILFDFVIYSWLILCHLFDVIWHRRLFDKRFITLGVCLIIMHIFPSILRYKRWFNKDIGAGVLYLHRGAAASLLMVDMCLYCQFDSDQEKEDLRHSIITSTSSDSSESIQTSTGDHHVHHQMGSVEQERAIETV